MLVWSFGVLCDFDDACAGGAGEVAGVVAGVFADPSSAVVALGEVGLGDVCFAEVAFVVVEVGHAVDGWVSGVAYAFDGSFDLVEFSSAHT